jgi:hypothetical protein
MRPELSEALYQESLKPLLTNSSLIAAERWLIMSTTYPTLRVAMLHHKTGRLRVAEFDFSDWDELPPEFTLIEAETLEPLPGRKWPTGQYWFQSGWSNTPLITTPRAFLCMRGLREYHTHFQHADDSWENYRNQADFSLVALVQKVGQKFQDANV